MSSRRAEPAAVKSGAALYAGAAAIGAVESAIPGGAAFSLWPVLAAVVLAPLVWLIGTRVPRNVLFALGPLGAGLIAYVVATSPGASDAAIFYAWPVLWIAAYFGWRHTAITVLAVFVAHGVALLTQAEGSFDRWFDVAVSAVVIAAVVRALAARNERLVERLTVESRIDPLTGLLNRRGLAERFDAEIARAVREQRPLATVVLDIDHFKRINDEHGHDTGDRTLTALAATLAEQSRGADIVARTGGEEFLVVLPGTDLESAAEFAERVRIAVAAMTDPVELTISAGVAAASPPTTASALTEAADQALYTAKRSGRNRVASASAASRAAVAGGSGGSP